MSEQLTIVPSLIEDKSGQRGPYFRVEAGNERFTCFNMGIRHAFEPGQQITCLVDRNRNGYLNITGVVGDIPPASNQQLANGHGQPVSRDPREPSIHRQTALKAAVELMAYETEKPTPQRVLEVATMLYHWLEGQPFAEKG